MAFKSSHNIYEMEKRVAGATVAAAGGQSDSFTDLTVNGTLTVGGVADFQNGINVTGGVVADAATIVNDLNLSSTSTTYYGDPSTDGSYKLVIVNAQLRMYKRVSGVWEEQQAWGV